MALSGSIPELPHVAKLLPHDGTIDWPSSFMSLGWPAPGSEDTELRCLMEQEAGHGEATVYAGVQG
jgi:hypothetical protein